MTAETTADRVNLVDVQTLVITRVQAYLLDEHRTWRYWPLVKLMSAQWACFDFSRADWGNLQPTEKFQRRLVGHAQEFLAPLAENPACRTVRRDNRWNNPGYCPPTPFGAYRWPFTCAMVQEVLWMPPEFVQGYDWWLDPRKPYRDANPYPSSGKRCDRDLSWDKGYILGHSVHHSPGRLTRWMAALTCPADPSAA